MTDRAGEVPEAPDAELGLANGTSCSPSAAESFLRSVLVFDDRLLEEIASGLKDPHAGVAAFATAFGEAGLVAMPVVPTWDSGGDGREEHIAATVKIARRSDVVVLDWEMPGPDAKEVGDTALEIIFNLAALSENEMRLVVIYSNYDHDAISESLNKKFPGCQADCCRNAHWKKDQLHIKIIPKEGSKSADEGEETETDEDTEAGFLQRVPFEELPSHLVAFFDHVTDGVVPRAVVRAMGTARDRTGRVLGRFTSKADLGLLAESLLKGSVTDSVRQLLDAVQDDAFGDLVPILEGPIRADLERLLSVSVDDLVSRGFVTSCEEDASDRKKASEVLARDAPIVRGKRSEFLKAPSHELMGTSPSNHHESDLSLVALVQTRASTDVSVAPTLQLGTVVEWSDDGTLAVCLMPLCDAARPKGQSFPFAVMGKADAPTTRHYPVSLGSGNEHSRDLGGLYSASMKLADLEYVTFKRHDTGPVNAVRIGECWVFHEKENTGRAPYVGSSRQFPFVCELRAPVAFKLVQQIVNDVSRFGRWGLDLPEWIRDPVDGL